MKGRRGSIALSAALFAALMGCQRVEVTTETFVNKADSRLVLKLESEPALRYDFQGKSHGAESSGVYTLQNGSGTFSGSYTYVFDNGNRVKQYTFRPQAGEPWTGRMDTSGSFTDEKGSLWRIQQFKKDAKQPLPLQQGK